MEVIWISILCFLLQLAGHSLRLPGITRTRRGSVGQVSKWFPYSQIAARSVFLFKAFRRRLDGDIPPELAGFVVDPFQALAVAQVLDLIDDRA